MKPMSTMFLLVALASTFATVVSAAVVVDYDITNANANISNVVGIASEDANVTPTTMQSFGALGGPFDFLGSFCYLGWPVGGALDPAKYYQFEITPDVGFGVTYASIDFAAASGGNEVELISWEIHASTDGFAGSDIPLGGNTFPANSTWHAFSLDISALGQQAGTITFRFYMYDATSTGFTGVGQAPTFGDQGRNFTVNGTVEELVVQTAVVSWGRLKAERR